MIDPRGGQQTDYQCIKQVSGAVFRTRNLLELLISMALGATGSKR